MVEWSPLDVPILTVVTQWICARCTICGALGHPVRPISQCPQCRDSNLSLLFWIVPPMCVGRGVPNADSVGLRDLRRHLPFPSLWMCQVGFLEAQVFSRRLSQIGRLYG